MNFYSKIEKKGGGYFGLQAPRMLTCHAYLMWRVDVARETTGGCDVAGPPMAHAWLTRVRRADTCARISYIDYIIVHISLFLELANDSNRSPI